MGAMGTEACASGAAVGAVDLLRLQATLLWHHGFARAAAALATALCDRLSCDRVALGWIHSGCSTVVALSHAADFDPRQAASERIAAIRACSLASLVFALQRLVEPLRLRDRLRENLLTRFRRAL